MATPAAVSSETSSRASAAPVATAQSVTAEAVYKGSARGFIWPR